MKRLSHARILLPAIAAILLPGCAFLGNTVEKVKIPVPKMPKLPGVGDILDFWPSEDRASEDDPTMPFNSRGTLGYGHTMRIDVYEGTRNTSQLYRSVLMVDERGRIDLGKFGTVKVGGSKLPEARRAIEAAVYTSARTARAITVHIHSVENVSLIAVTGDVQEDEYIPMFDGIRVSRAVTVAGGRKLGSSARALYLIREGEPRFFPSLGQADAAWKPKPGDIIQLSPDL